MRLSAAMRAASGELARGEIDFDRFVRRTRADWRRMALSLHRKHQTPPGVTWEDVEGELLMQAWRAWRRGFDPSRSACAGAYVVCTAVWKTKTWIHGQRIGPGGLHGNPTRRPSNIGVPASWLDDPERASSWLDAQASEGGASQEARARALDAISALLATLSPRDREVLEIVLDAGGDLAVGASAVLGSPEILRREWLDSEGAAVRYLDRVLERARTVILGVGITNVNSFA